jgi:hypothetical protein
MASSLLGLAPGGGYLAICITANAGGLLHHLFTITPHSCEMSWLFVSVALIRQVSSSRRVPRPGCYPTPCSMECGLSSAPTTQDRDRPTDLRRHYHTRKDTARQPQLTRFQQFSYRWSNLRPACCRPLNFVENLPAIANLLRNSSDKR